MFLSFLQSAIRFSAIFLFGSVGETLTEKSGNLNLGIPGIMCMGGAGGLIGAAAYIKSLENISQMNGPSVVIIAMITAMLFGGLGGLIYSVLTISMRCNQNVTGLALTTFGIGLLAFVGGTVDTTGFTTVAVYFTKSFPFEEKLGGFGELFFSYGALVYIAFILAIISAVVIKKTRV